MSRRKGKMSTQSPKKGRKVKYLNKKVKDDSRGITRHTEANQNDRHTMSDMLWNYYLEISKKRL